MCINITLIAHTLSPAKMQSDSVSYNTVRHASLDKSSIAEWSNLTMGLE